MRSYILLAALFVLAGIHPTAAPTAPPLMSCDQGGLVWLAPPVPGTTTTVYCVDPAALPKPPTQIFTGMPCNPPGTADENGGTIYALLSDKTCLPLIVVVKPHLANFQGAYQNLFVKIPPSNLTPLEGVIK